MRCEEACHWFKPSWIIWASSLDQVKEKEAHGNNLVQELVINVKFNKVVHHDFTSDTRFNKRYIIVSLQVIYMVIQVVFIQVDLVQQWWFHKWSSTLSDQFKSTKLPSSRRAQDSSRLTNTLTYGEEPHYKVSRSRILLVSYMWHFNVVFMLSHVVVTSGVNFNQIESVHQKWRFKTQPSTQVQLFVSNHKCFIWLPTRGVQVVTL